MVSVDQLRTPTADQARVDQASAAILRMPPVEAEEAARTVRLQRFALRVEQWAGQASSGEFFKTVGESEGESETDG